MANNFRRTGNYYVSKGGHDSNDGLTPDTAKKSIPSSTDNARELVIGAGFYNITSLSHTSLSISSDGKAVFDFNGSAGIIFRTSTGVTSSTGLYIKNATGIFFSGADTHTGNIYENVNFTSTRNSNLIKCSLLNCDTSALPFGGLRTLNSGSLILINGDHAVDTMYSSYSNFAATLVKSSVNTTIYYSNIQGKISLGGVLYAIQDQFTGTPQDNGYDIGVEWLTEANLTSNGYTGTIIGWDAAVATCINRDPRFNDASKGIFTLKADSPHLGRAFDGISNIGGTDYEDLELVGNLSSGVLLAEVSEAIDNTTNVNDWVLKAGYDEGHVRIIKKVTDSDYKTLAKIPYYGNYSFDSDEIGGTSGNFNVPDSKPQTNQYPEYTTTTSDALDVNSIIIAGHGRSAGEWIRVEGQDREISSVDTNTIYFLTAVRAIVLSGTEVKIGSESELAALTPNRLNMELRTSKAALVDASNWDIAATWDNDNLATAGNYLAQELNNTPMIDNLNGVGFGDDSYDPAFGNAIRAKYVDIKIWIRNNYKS